MRIAKHDWHLLIITLYSCFVNSKQYHLLPLILFLLIYLSQPLNLWALLCTRLFRQPNYWRSASYATCLPYMWTSCDLVVVYTHAYLQCMLRQRFNSRWLQGNLQLRRERTINKHSKALEQCTLTTRLRRRPSGCRQLQTTTLSAILCIAAKPQFSQC